MGICHGTYAGKIFPMQKGDSSTGAFKSSSGRVPTARTEVPSRPNSNGNQGLVRNTSTGTYAELKPV